MASGCVIPYRGKRGTTWRIKYRDASGRQRKETVGAAADGWTRRKAEAELRARLVAVERDGYVRPEPQAFDTFARTWLDEYAAAKALKLSTERGYRLIVERHLVPHFGRARMGDIDVAAVERYVAAKRRAGLSAATINRQLNVLSLLAKAAIRRDLIRLNPVALIDRPREVRRKWRIFTPAETVAVERAFGDLIAAAEDAERDDLIVARRLYLTPMATGIRRGEAAGLRWRAVLLADPDGPVMRIEETYVCNQTDTPKSAAGNRTISIGAKLAAELWEHRGWSAYSGDDDLVFPNPRTGTPYDVARYAALFRRALAAAGIDGYVRPSHDLRHSSITNAAAAGTPPEALMSRAGHTSYATTKRYIDTAGERFRGEAARLEERLWGSGGTKNGYQVPGSPPAEATAP